LQNSAVAGIDPHQPGGKFPVRTFSGQAVKLRTRLVREERRKMQAGRNLTDQLARCRFHYPRTPRNSASTLVSAIHFESERFIDEELAGGCGQGF
jgi:hypothetical protein